MEYNEYELEDFLACQEFRDLVLKPNPMICLFWKKWLKYNPHKASTFLAAKEIILSFNYDLGKEIDGKVQKELLNSILRKSPPIK